MKVSKNWLSDYLDLSKYSDTELFDQINAHINEIESYEKMVNATNLTVGYVLECVPHPDSDHLHVCQVEVLPGKIEQIVCGAPNVDKGQYVIVANVGALLPGDFKISRVNHHFYQTRSGYYPDQQPLILRQYNPHYPCVWYVHDRKHYQHTH